MSNLVVRYALRMTDEQTVTSVNDERSGMRRGLVRAEIYDQATRLFAERGYAGTSLQDIASAVGLTRPALYHYFRNKDELLAELVTEITAEAASGISEIAARDDLAADDKLRAIVHQTAHHNGENAERFRLLIRSEADLPDEVGAAYEENRKFILRTMVDIIEAGIADGTFRPQSPQIAAFGIFGITNWVAWWYRPDSRFDLDPSCDELAEFAVRGLLADEGRPAANNPLDIVRSLRHEVDRLEGALQSTD